MKWAEKICTGRASHQAVLYALAWRHHEKTDRCDPSIAGIAEHTQLERKAVMRSLVFLEGHGYIESQKKLGARTRYLLNFDKTGDETSAQKGTGSGTSGDEATSAQKGTGLDDATSPESGTGSDTPTGAQKGTCPLEGPVPLGYSTGPIEGPDREDRDIKTLPPVIPHDETGDDESESTDLLGDPSDQHEKPERFVAVRMPLPIAVNADAWREWCEFRTSKRKAISQKAARKQIALLEKYPPAVQQAIVDQSITNDYQGLFPPKGGIHAQSGPGAGRDPDPRRLSGVERTRLAREQQRERERRRAGGAR